MKLAVQEGMLPGESLEEKFKGAKKMGFEAVELNGRDLWEREEEIIEVSEKTELPISTVVGGFDGCLLDPDRSVREQAIQNIRKILESTGRIKAGGFILVPIFGPVRLPDLTPYKNAEALEQELFNEILSQLANHAEKVEATILLEPLNRYETHFINTLEQAVEYCREVKSPSVRVVADFFHMNLEETDIAQSLQQAGKYVTHIHLADSNRIQPGFGHTDFRSAFASLKKVGFEGYMSLECRIAGKPEVSLAECVKHLQQEMDEEGGEDSKESKNAKETKSSKTTKKTAKKTAKTASKSSKSSK